MRIILVMCQKIWENLSRELPLHGEHHTYVCSCLACSIFYRPIRLLLDYCLISPCVENRRNIFVKGWPS